MSEPKHPGRPALDPDDPSVQVGFKMPSKQYAAMCEQAKRERLAWAEWARHVLQAAIWANKKT